MRNGIERQLIIVEKLMVIGHRLSAGDRYRDISMRHEKSKSVTFRDVCLYDERWPTKALVRARTMPSDANANSISFSPGDSIHPERRRSPLCDVDVAPLVREMSN